MGIFDENNNLIEISKDDMHDAMYSSARLDENIQKRAFANVLGARLGIKFLKKLNINADNFNSLYTIPAILKDMDISDICIDNIRADIRIVADENHLCIPKSHYEYNITPDIYIFMKLSEDLSTATFIGAIAPDEVNKSVENRDYYFINNSDLYNENSLKNAINKGKPKSNVQIAENEVIKAESMLVNFIDGDIMNHEKHFVYEVLKQSPELQNLFREFEKFENISTDLAHTEEILSDSVLDVLGAQQIYNEDLSDGEFASDVNLDVLADETVSDFVEDFMEDNKEEDMLEDENIIEGEFEELPDDAQVEEPGELEELPTDEDLASLKTTNNFEHIDELNQNDSFDFSEFTENDETSQSENKGFEGFEGLDTNNSSDISFDDVTSELATPELSLDDIEVSSPDTLNLSPEETIDLDRIQNLDDLDSQDETLDLSDFETLDSQTTSTEENFELNNTIDSTVEPLEEIQPIEDLSPIENSEKDLQQDFTQDEEMVSADSLQSLENFDENSVEDLTTQDSENIETESLIDAVQNEGMQLSAEENFESIEANETPIDLTLPDLGSNFGFEDLDEDEETSEINEIQNDEPVQEDTTSTLDDIAQNVNFENIETDGFEIPELPKLEEIQPVEDIEPIEPIEDLSMDQQEQQNEQPQEQQTEENSKTDKTDDEDFSGLEEFTMDMASEVERQNPNLLNPQGPVENYDASQGFGTQFDDFNPTSGFNPAPEFVEENMQHHNEDATPPLEETHTDSGFQGFEGFENLDTSTQDNSIESSEFSDINLDDLDDFDDDDDEVFNSSETTQGTDSKNIDNINSELDNLINDDDYDFSELNLDDIDLNDPEIQNIDIELNNLDDLSSLDNIPAIDEQPQNNEIPIQNQEEYQNQYMQEQMGIPTENPQDYTPNFNANDQNTIETLYEDSPQNSMPGDAMNQSFNQNNVNYTQQPKTPSKKKSSPLLGILLIVLVCAFAYTKKDMIIEKFNQNKGVTVSQDQNMPIEGETQEEKQDRELLNETPNETTSENPEEAKQGIGAIPGEAGGPQDIASMNASLNQKGSMARQTPQAVSKTPEPLATSTVKRLYWEVPQELTYNDSIVNFLKTVGKTIKFSMQSDLLNSTELPYSNKMIVNVVIKKDGSVDSVTSTVSSGSKQIDNIVLQSVKAALKYVKAPTSEFKNDSYDFSLIINF